MAYCPHCISFGQECHPDPEDYDIECPYYKEDQGEVEQEVEVEQETEGGA